MSGMGDANDPGDAYEAAADFYLDEIAGGKGVEVAAINRNALDAMPFAP